MSGHTPGPWAVCVVPPNGCWHSGLTIGAADPSDARRVCDVHDWGIDWPAGTPQHDMTVANAHLIAAAPLLLDKVREYASNCAECGGSGFYTYDINHPRKKKGDPCPDCADIRELIDLATKGPQA